MRKEGGKSGDVVAASNRGEGFGSRSCKAGLCVVVCQGRKLWARVSVLLNGTSLIKKGQR